MHHLWLGQIYPWAGEYRTVNLIKSGFAFAAAREVPRLMSEFERRQLSIYTPCRPGETDDLAEALAVVHAELVLIHPFRDGNGRCARLLSVLMRLQAGLPPLDYGGLTGRTRRKYVAAIHAAMAGDYGPMTGIFFGVIRRTLRRYARPA